MTVDPPGLFQFTGISFMRNPFVRAMTKSSISKPNRLIVCNGKIKSATFPENILKPLCVSEISGIANILIASFEIYPNPRRYHPECSEI